jgi:hypothetical protein
MLLPLPLLPLPLPLLPLPLPFLDLLLLLLARAVSVWILMTVITTTIRFPVTQDSSAHIAVKHIR